MLDFLFKESSYQVNWTLVNEHKFNKNYNAQVINTEYGDKLLVTIVQKGIRKEAWFKIDKNQDYEVGQHIPGNKVVVKEYEWSGDADDEPDNTTMYRASWE